MSEQDFNELEKTRLELVEYIASLFADNPTFSAHILYKSTNCEKCYNKWRIFSIEIDE